MNCKLITPVHARLPETVKIVINKFHERCPWPRITSNSSFLGNTSWKWTRSALFREGEASRMLVFLWKKSRSWRSSGPNGRQDVHAECDQRILPSSAGSDSFQDSIESRCVPRSRGSGTGLSRIALFKGMSTLNNIAWRRTSK